VREAASGKSSLRMLDVTVPPYDGRAVFALPPLVLDEDERWLKLELGAGSRAKSAGPGAGARRSSSTPGRSFRARASRCGRARRSGWC
jgi:hypothetical protein